MAFFPYPIESLTSKGVFKAILKGSYHCGQVLGPAHFAVNAIAFFDKLCRPVTIGPRRARLGA
ncbi:MAG: hypothetical protein LBJ61_02635 [Deltaproteobacteria bacterium]|nr:hypothetical protein [Deltaproteobacteria bacterium]